MKKKVTRLSLLALTSSLIIISCKPKEEITPEPEPTPNPVAPLNILNANSGYSTIYEAAHSLGGLYNANSININDFTLETNNHFNFSYYTEIATQQSPYRTQYRYTKDLVSNQFVPLPSGVGQYPLNQNMYYDNVSYQYFPYSNIYSVSALKYSTGFGYNNGNSFINDINASVSSANPIGSPDFCFRYPVMNSGTGFGYFSKFSSVNTYPVVGSTYSMFNGAIGSQANLNLFKGGCLHEVYTGNGLYEFFAIGVKADSVKVYKFNYTSYGGTSYPVYTYSVVNSKPTTMDFATTTRHYSIDGKILSFMCKDITTNKISTFIYNFQSNSLTQNLNQVTLDYSGTGSDIDLDENGDVYYTGYANNGTNNNGVSVYKKSGNGAPALVGNDNILLSGTVVKLRVLLGKVYCAVTAKQSGKEVYQISILKQQ